MPWPCLGRAEARYNLKRSSVYGLILRLLLYSGNGITVFTKGESYAQRSLTSESHSIFAPMQLGEVARAKQSVAMISLPEGPPFRLPLTARRFLWQGSR